MLMGEALVERLKDDPAIENIVGERIFWDVRPQTAPGNALPAIVLLTVAGSRFQDLEGLDGTGEATVQASCYAERKSQARALAEAVIAAAVPPGQVGDVDFDGGDAAEPRDLPEQTDTGFIYHAAVDLTVRWAKVF